MCEVGHGHVGMQNASLDVDRGWAGSRLPSARCKPPIMLLGSAFAFARCVGRAEGGARKVEGVGKRMLYEM